MASTFLDVRRAADRFHTLADGVESWHCFSYGHHYDPANTSFGPLVAFNDEIVQPGGGFGPHHHADVEIVTWPVRGVLAHQDSTGEHHVNAPGVVQRLSAGSGVVHSETFAWSPRPGAMSNVAPESLRFIQMWITPDQPGGKPAFDQGTIDLEAMASRYVVVASGRPRHRAKAAVVLAASGTALLARRLEKEQVEWLPKADLVHVFVVHGAVELEEAGERLGEGDSLRLRAAGAVPLRCSESAEILVWEMDAPP